MEAKVHRRFEDAAQEQGKRKFPELHFAEHAPGGDHQNQQQRCRFPYETLE